MIWDYKNLSSKTTSSWWLCSENECCVKADSEKVRQRETDRVAGHIHLGTHHHHHSIIMLLNIVCSWTYAPRFSSSSSLLSSMLLNMRMQLDIYISVIIIVIVNIIPTTIISTILCSWAYTPQCSSHHHLELSLSSERITQREMKLRVAIVWQYKEILNSWKGTKVICKSFSLFMDRQFNYNGQLLKIITNTNHLKIMGNTEHD